MKKFTHHAQVVHARFIVNRVWAAFDHKAVGTDPCFTREQHPQYRIIPQQVLELKGYLAASYHVKWSSE
jgi:hypothetical protein